ncbi:MAG: RNA polymerase sigma factor SigJ [Acidimicrobiales bacterium]|nr:RNA polymerase sigma factor SigJ [Acidimicrobiales bacterium]
MNSATLERAAVEARPRLVAIAYRMLGSMSDAEDVVQDALVRAQRNAPADVDEPVAYLTTVTTRLAIDHLRSARVRRESYVGPWLPEPVLADPLLDAATQVEMADSLSMAFLVVLEALSPEERATLLLHDVFGHSHAEVGAMLGRSVEASRQMLRRARVAVEAERPRFAVDPARHEALVRRFLAACHGGDMAAFLALLTDDVTYVADGGGVVTAVPRPIRGAARVARLLGYFTRLERVTSQFALVPINGQPAVAVREDGRLTGAVLVDPAPDGRIAAVRWVRNPTKLAPLARALSRG